MIGTVAVAGNDVLHEQVIARLRVGVIVEVTLLVSLVQRLVVTASTLSLCPLASLVSLILAVNEFLRHPLDAVSILSLRLI
jgi:hypothetical protein